MAGDLSAELRIYDLECCTYSQKGTLFPECLPAGPALFERRRPYCHLTTPGPLP